MWGKRYGALLSGCHLSEGKSIPFTPDYLQHNVLLFGDLAISIACTNVSLFYLALCSYFGHLFECDASENR